MLHFIGDFFDKTRASLARAAFKRGNLNFFVKGAFFSGDRYRVLSHPRYRPPTPVLMSDLPTLFNLSYRGW